MTKFVTIGLIALFAGLLTLGCEEEQSDPEILMPLVGEYNLTDMTISVEARTIRDTTLTFLTPYNGNDTYLLPANALVMARTDAYSHQDEDPISGTVILENNGSASLAGMLPVNWGSGCEPFLLISSLASDGSWAADTSDGTFSIDLVVDALDIDGTFSISGNELQIRYFTIVEVDERPVSTVNIDGVDVNIVPGCFAVSTVTERVLNLSIVE